MAATEKAIPWVQWQKPMVRVLWACAPLAVAAVYFFGWRALATIVLCNAVAYAVEWPFCRNWREPVSSAVFVTGTLFAFSLPPLLPFWMAALGVAFGVLFGKMVFGGFGRNVFNPAMTGRAFVYVCFGQPMTGQWCAPYSGLPGGFGAWGRSLAELGRKLADGSDAIATATPGALLKLPPGEWAARGIDPAAFGIGRLFLGDCSGVLGGTPAFLVLLCGLWLVWRKTAQHRIVAGGFLAFAVVQTVLWRAGWGHAPDPLRAAFSGSLLIGLFFYATDPVSAAATDEGRWIYGALIGALSVLIATFSAWPAGTMFAILLANMFAPILDYAVRSLKPKPVRKAATAGAKARPAAAAAGGPA